MATLFTESGYNMFDMLSMIQKGIRRGDFNVAGFAAQQLRGKFRSTMWNRIYVTSAEDCFGILTKELVALREADMQYPDDRNVGRAVALLCSALKSRDACYYSCNFVLDTRCPRKIVVPPEFMEDFHQRVGDGASSAGYDQFGFLQDSLFETLPIPDTKPKEYEEKEVYGASLEIAFEHRDMDMSGYYMDKIRRTDWQFLWKTLEDYAATHHDGLLRSEIAGLHAADTLFNGKKSLAQKNDIFISKAAMLLLYAGDKEIGDVRGSDIISPESNIDWSKIEVKGIGDCRLADGRIPDYVYDCHTLKGKKMGKTDWDMTLDEQAALYPLKRCYFDDSSWIYTYEQDYREGRMNDKEMAPIRKFAETHPANPVEPYPYE